MESLLNSKIFPRPLASYSNDLSYLSFIERIEPAPTFLHNNITHKIPIRYYHQNDNGPIILICHGNNSDIGDIDMEYHARRLNSNICAFDYAGYGLHSCPSSSQLSCQEDILAVYRWLKDTKPMDRFFIYGYSLGSGMACYLANYLCKQNESLTGLILVAPLYSVFALKTDIWLPFDMFTNYNLAPEISCPTIVIHGDKDEIIPVRCGAKLAGLFPNLKKFKQLKDIGHCDIKNEEHYADVEYFITDCIMEDTGKKQLVHL